MDKKIETLKKEYPVGTRILLLSMGPDPRPIPPYTEGVVDHVNDVGTIHVSFEGGRALGIIAGEDEFIKLGERHVVRVDGLLSEEKAPAEKCRPVYYKDKVIIGIPDGCIRTVGEMVLKTQLEKDTRFVLSDILLDDIFASKATEEQDAMLKKTYGMTFEELCEALCEFCAARFLDTYDWNKSVRQQIEEIVNRELLFLKMLADSNKKVEERCRDCGYLIENDEGAWICDDCGKDIHAIPDSDCSANQTF